MIPLEDEIWQGMLTLFLGSTGADCKVFLDDARQMGVEAGLLTIEVARREYAIQMEGIDWKFKFLACIKQIDGRVSDIRYTVRPDQPSLLDMPSTAAQVLPTRSAKHSSSQARGERFVLIEPPVFHSYQTFENLVVHAGNQAAVNDAKKMVAMSQAERRIRYRFIVGKTGTGKTHLLHAIGNALRKGHPELAIVLLNGKRFAEEVADSFKHRTTSELKARFRGVDVVLVDAAHGIFPGFTGKFGDVFFEIVEALEDQEVQVVMMSEDPPDKLNIASPAMRSRIESGVYHLLSPSREAKLGYVESWQSVMRVRIDEGTAQSLADIPNSDFRILGGALETLYGDGSSCGAQDVPNVIDEAIQVSRFHHGERRISYEDIAAHVAETTKVTLAMLKGAGQAQRITNARRLFCHLSAQLIDPNQSEMARYLGKHPSSVSGWIDQMEKRLMSDRGYASTIESMIASLKG